MKEPTEKQKIGRLGEHIAQKYLQNKGFMIIGQNYLKKCGEIDIIAQKGDITHFIEVKTVSELVNSESPDSRLGRSENIGDFSGFPRTALGDVDVSRETDNYRPEDNVHPNKLKRLARVIQLYLYEKHANGEPEWVFDVITVQLDMKKRKAYVKFLENLVI